MLVAVGMSKFWYNTAPEEVFIDELPWLDTRMSKFVPALEHFWNAYSGRFSNVVTFDDLFRV